MINHSNWYQKFMIQKSKGVKVSVVVVLFLFLVIIAVMMDRFDPGGNAYTHLF